MFKLNEKGIAHLLVPIILLIGLIVGVYLVTSGNPLKLFSKASNPPIVFKSADGKALPMNNQDIPQSTSPSVKIEFTSTLGPPAAGVSSPVSGPVKLTTKSFRYAEDPTDLSAKSYQPYTNEPMIVNYTFDNPLAPSNGQKSIWVDFLTANGKTDRRSAQIELVFPSPTPTPTSTLSPIPILTSSLGAPEMVYPQNGQTLDLKGAYMFKVKPVTGASGYLFGFFQNGVMIFENQRDTGKLSSDGEFAIWESDPAHAKFRAGEVKVMIWALVNNKRTDAREIAIILKP